MKELYILILLFFAYAFIGWLMEVLVALVSNHKFINRGFLIGPICPIYGCGGILIILLLSRYQNDPVALFLLAIILCAVLEYITSYLMEKIFKNRWWDYSNQKYNINGRVCLEFAIPFGLAALIMFYGINPLLINLLSKIPTMGLQILCIISLVIFVIDLILSFNVIINLKNISNSLRCDSTEIITKKVKEILSSKNILHRRLLSSFPNMQVFNKMAILKEKIKNDKYRLKLEKKKIKSKKKKKKK